LRFIDSTFRAPPKIRGPLFGSISELHQKSLQTKLYDGKDDGKDDGKMTKSRVVGFERLPLVESTFFEIQPHGQHRTTDDGRRSQKDFRIRAAFFGGTRGLILNVG
jgi:hypothetical protein